MSYPSDAQPFARLQREIGEWGDRTFPQATPASIVAHLQREAAELKERPWSREEMADVAMLLCHLAHRQGIDLQTEVEQKFALNRMRKWGKPDAEGVVEHIRERL